MRGLRAPLLIVVALLLLCGLAVQADSLADRVGRVSALCLTGTANGEITGAQVNPVTCTASLACLAYQSFSPEQLALLQYGAVSYTHLTLPTNREV